MNALGIGDREFCLFMRFLGVEHTLAPEMVDENLDLEDLGLVIIQDRYFEEERVMLQELIGDKRLPILSRFTEMGASHE